MIEAALICAEANPDLIDINYGCPVKKVVCKGAGASMLQDIPKMVRLTKAIVDAVDKPVTVKTRLGWDDSSKNVVEVAERLQDIGIKAISIHGRTRSQMYKGDADWSLIAQVKNNPRMHIPVFGNGDIDSPEKVLAARDRFGVDGVMIGRATIGYPWFFNEVKHFLATGEHLDPPTLNERANAAQRHLDLSVQWKGEKLAIAEMRRHYGNYFRNYPNFKELRQTLVTCDSLALLSETFDEIRGGYALRNSLVSEPA
jgi:nifR3 family TIM-barrel protein